MVPKEATAFAGARLLLFQWGAMKHRASHAFWDLYYALPAGVREQADKAFALLKENPQHRSLHFKKIEGTTDRWSVRVGSQYRALARQVGDEMRWHWIGTHNEYNRKLR